MGTGVAIALTQGISTKTWSKTAFLVLVAPSSCDECRCWLLLLLLAMFWLLLLEMSPWLSWLDGSLAEGLLRDIPEKVRFMAGGLWWMWWGGGGEKEQKY